MSIEENIQWALDILKPDDPNDPFTQENLLWKNAPFVWVPIISLTGVAFINFMQKRPIYASLPRYFIALTVGLAAAKVLNDAKIHRHSLRDQIMRDYINLHPEAFPPPVRTTFNKEWNDWVPIR